MLQQKFLLSAAEMNQQICFYSISFARLTTTDNVEDAESAGSGTLVTVGSLHGILTAAHVVNALPKSGKVGLILCADNPAQFGKQGIIMEHTEAPVSIRAETFGPNGPDLAFLKLTDEACGWLKAKNSFYSLIKRRDDVLEGKHPATSYTDSIIGTIHELTQPLPGDNPRVRRVQFSAIFCGVRMSAVKYLNDHRLNYFQMQTEHEPGFSIPKSFQGTSGGAVWRFYVAKQDDKVKVIDRRLIAVPFYEGVSSDGKPEIACHDAKDIYGKLVDEISTRWPEETHS